MKAKLKDLSPVEYRTQILEAAYNICLTLLGQFKIGPFSLLTILINRAFYFNEKFINEISEQSHLFFDCCCFYFYHVLS